MTRCVALLALLLGPLTAGPLAAQAPVVEGRWRVHLRPPDPTRETVRGDLDLRPDSVPVPTLRLDTDSTPEPFPLTDLQRPAPDSLVLRRDAPDGLELAGRWNGVAWVGTARDRLGPRGTWEAERLPDGAEYYADLPRFRLRQLVLGPRGEPVQVPASWWATARGLGADRPAATWWGRHQDAARAAGVSPADTGQVDAWLHGLADRGRLREAMVQGLLAVRAGVPDTAGRARFDALFRDDGRWVTDLHDAAAEWIRVRHPAWTWEVSRETLARAGLVPIEAPEPMVLAELAALWALGARDTAAGRTRAEALQLGAPADSTLPAVLAGYAAAAVWHGDAVRYLTGRLAPPALLRPGVALRAAPLDGAGARATLALRGPIVDSCVVLQNVEARRWLARHGRDGLARVFARLAPDYGQAAQVEVGGRKLTLSTPASEAGRDAAGLAEASVIIWDPREPPLFATGRVIDAAARLVFLEGWRARDGLVGAGDLCYLPDAEPHLLAGFGAALEGRAAERAGLPLLAAAAAARRATVADRDPRAPVVLGPFLVEAHARRTQPDDPGALLGSLLGLGYDWPRIAALWPDPPKDARPLMLPPDRGPVLVPSIDFFIESGLPTALALRVLPLSPRQ